jgi:geranylgeranyl pyrophosphate synthase
MNHCATFEKLARGDLDLHAYLARNFADKITELEHRLQAQAGPAPVSVICADLFAAGGKRLRALATLIVARAFAFETDVALCLGEVAELIHAATLLHDDVIDEADTRRGKTAARRRWSNTLSVLSGDYLLLRSMERVAELGVPALTTFHRETLFELVAAEAAQNVALHDGDDSIAGYLEIAVGKTGALFAFACAAPATYNGDTASAAALADFGRQIGIAFQIADDLRDLLGTDSTKPQRLDLADGVPSLPLRLAAQGDEALRGQLAALGQATPAPETVAALTARVLATDAVAQTVTIGHQHAARGLASLAGLPALPALGAVGHWLQHELCKMEQRSCHGASQ